MEKKKMEMLVVEQVACPSCGCQNDGKAYFCGKCGRFLLDVDFGGTGAMAEANFKLKRIADNLKENPHMDILWNDTVDAYTRKAENIRSLLRLNDLGIDSEELNQKVDTFLQMCRKPDFEIAFVGAVKAGKSTLINALLGKNYASTDPNPETAVLTKFRSSEQDYVRVKFYSEQEWKSLWKSVQSGGETFLKLYRSLEGAKHKAEWVGHADYYVELENSKIKEELEKWSSSRSVRHFFVREIEVGISTLPKDFPKQVVFVDTPGLFDPVAFRSQISIDYISSANAVLMCIKARDLHGEEVKTVESVFSFSGHKRSKIFLIATNWDELNNVVADWVSRYQYIVNFFTGKAFYHTKEMAASHTMYVDAYHYNLCREYQTLDKFAKQELSILLMKIQNNVMVAQRDGAKIPRRLETLMDIEGGILSPSDLKKLMDITNVHVINKVIVDELVSQYSQILFGDIRILYNEIRQMTERIAGERKKALGERITISGADIRQIEDKVEETKRSRDEIRECQKQLTAMLRSLNDTTEKRLGKLRSRLG